MNIDRCFPRWDAEDWSVASCTASCGSQGVQQRRVQCLTDNKGQSKTMNPSYCNQRTMPNYLQACNRFPCTTSPPPPNDATFAQTWTTFETPVSSTFSPTNIAGVSTRQTTAVNRTNSSREDGVSEMNTVPSTTRTSPEHYISSVPERLQPGLETASRAPFNTSPDEEIELTIISNVESMNDDLQESTSRYAVSDILPIKPNQNRTLEKDDDLIVERISEEQTTLTTISSTIRSNEIDESLVSSEQFDRQHFKKARHGDDSDRSGSVEANSLLTSTESYEIMPPSLRPVADSTVANVHNMHNAISVNLENVDSLQKEDPDSSRRRDGEEELPRAASESVRSSPVAAAKTESTTAKITEFIVKTASSLTNAVSTTATATAAGRWDVATASVRQQSTIR